MNTRELNLRAWNEAHKELDSARCMFEYANNPYYIDLAIQLEDAAKLKIGALKILQEYEHITTTPCEPRTIKHKQTLADKIKEWLEPVIEPLRDKGYDMKPLSELTWVDLRRMAGFEANPVDNYDDLKGGATNEATKTQK